MNKRTKIKQKGITLIALVITIIILLILGGVTIAMLKGDNGVLTKTTEAKTKTYNASLEEEVKLFNADIAAEYFKKKYVENDPEVKDMTLKDYIVKRIKELESEGKNILPSGAKIRVNDLGYIVYEQTDGTKKIVDMSEDGTIDLETGSKVEKEFKEYLAGKKEEYDRKVGNGEITSKSFGRYIKEEIEAAGEAGITLPSGAKLRYDETKRKIVYEDERGVTTEIELKDDGSYEIGKVVLEITREITMDPNGGEGLPNIIKIKEGNIAEIDFSYEPEKTGYTFLGWSRNPDATTPEFTADGEKSFTMPEGNVTLYAVFSANTYTVVYNGNGETSGSTGNSTHVYDVESNLATNGYSKTGYTFLGWSTNASAIAPAYTDGQKVSNLIATNGETVNLYAVWKARTYTVVYNGNGATSGNMENSTFLIDIASNLTTNGYSRTNHSFLGWSANSSAMVATYTNGQSVNNLTTTEGSIVTLYAIWHLDHVHTASCYVHQHTASCYTVHTHTGNSTSGGGCYGTANQSTRTTYHSESCGWRVSETHSASATGNGNGGYYDCPLCGKQFSTGSEYLRCDVCGSVFYKYLICGQCGKHVRPGVPVEITSDLEYKHVICTNECPGHEEEYTYYSTNCGKEEGQTYQTCGLSEDLSFICGF